jgi:crotonobetainyl-CoA:carnitine CoA-transferase CaiB-like acyl-CoA transferase
MLVLDLTRMLPGAVVARQLVDLGARLIKVEEPGGGDPMRLVPPLVGGVGVGFSAFYRGAESIKLDLKTEEDAGRLQILAASADVLIENFRPGTLESWGLGWEKISIGNPRLVWCSLSSFGSRPGVRDRVAHDLNLSAMAGILELVGGDVPRLQIADVSSGLMASSAILAALLARANTGEGRRIEQPLAAGPLPFLTWSWAERATDPSDVIGTLLGGSLPCYRRYRCGDGRDLVVGALEPKFWAGLMHLLDLQVLNDAAFAVGEEGTTVAATVEKVLASHPREHWLRLAHEEGLPLTAVHDVDEAREDPVFAAAGLMEDTPMPGGGFTPGVGPYLSGLARTPDRPAPLLGEHTEEVFAEFGLESARR